MAEAKKGFSTPPEVTEYLDRKGLKPGFSWLDVSPEEHAHAFTVAKATELELLTEFRQSLSAAIAEGRGYETWRDGVRQRLKALGWARPRLVEDPTGREPARAVNFASDRRLRTIYWGNTASARSAGQWQRAQRTKAVLPYILYVRTTAADPRPEHLRWVGVILPIDDPFWQTHWPPNGWLCKCTVRQIGSSERSRLLNATKMPDGTWYTDTAPEIVTRPFVNRRTGEVHQVPEGIDAGWETNPGRTRATTLIQNLEARLAGAEPGDATKALQDLWSDPYVRVAPKLQPKAWLPAGVSEPLAAELGARSPVASITGEAVAERIGRHGMAVEDFQVLPIMLREAIVLPDPRGKRSVRALLYRDGKTWWRAFVTRSETGYLRVTSLHQQDASKVRHQFEAAGKPWEE